PPPTVRPGPCVARRHHAHARPRPDGGADRWGSRLGDRRRGGSRARVRAATPVRRRHRVRPSRLRLPSARRTVAPRRLVAAAAGGRSAQKGVSLMATLLSLAAFAAATVVRSEERRVGKECRARWSAEREKNNALSKRR